MPGSGWKKPSYSHESRQVPQEKTSGVSADSGVPLSGAGFGCAPNRGKATPALDGSLVGQEDDENESTVVRMDDRADICTDDRVDACMDVAQMTVHAGLQTSVRAAVPTPVRTFVRTLVQTPITSDAVWTMVRT